MAAVYGIRRSERPDITADKGETVIDNVKSWALETGHFVLIQ